MFCKNCGTSYEDNIKFCPVCGNAQIPDEAPVYTTAPAEPAKQDNPDNTMGMISMILGIISVALGGALPMAIVALVLSVITKNKAKEIGADTPKAKVGFILGIVSLVLYVVCVIVGIIVGIIYGASLGAMMGLAYM